MPSDGGTGGQPSKSTECAEGNEAMDEDEASDTEMASGQGTFIAGTGDVREHRAAAKQKDTAVEVSEDTWM